MNISGKERVMYLINADVAVGLRSEALLHHSLSLSAGPLVTKAQH